jgi:hypothetical protein
MSSSKLLRSLLHSSSFIDEDDHEVNGGGGGDYYYYYYYEKGFCIRKMRTDGYQRSSMFRVLSNNNYNELHAVQNRMLL